MPNYQNTMRYGRPGNMRKPCGQNAGYGMPHTMPNTESRCCTPGPAARTDRMPGGEDACCTPAPKPEKNCCAISEGPERRDRKVSRSCGCRKEDPLYDMPIAMAYVPWQTWREIYEICDGFQTGTIFEELDKPFLGRGGRA